MLGRLAVTFVASGIVFFLQILKFDKVSPASVDKARICPRPFGQAVSVRDMLHCLVTSQVLGVVLIVPRIVLVIWVGVVVVSFFWRALAEPYLVQLHS